MNVYVHLRNREFYRLRPLCIFGLTVIRASECGHKIPITFFDDRIQYGYF